MTAAADLEILLVVVPGLESALREEAVEKGFRKPTVVTGGVVIRGSWRDVWRANLELRGASKVLVRLGAFRAMHLAQLDRRARQFPWSATLRPDVAVRVEASCSASRIYHAKAASQRIAAAIRETLGAPVSAEAEICVKARIEDDLCTISLDSSGELLHRRGHKQAVAKAPMRETMAALFLRSCGYRGKEAVLDPMCGSGSFVIEAAEIAAGLNPGRSRRFAFEMLAGFDADAWQAMRSAGAIRTPPPQFFGSDRDAGAIRMSEANARRAGVSDVTRFRRLAIGDLTAPTVSPGLVVVNPPYGERLGERGPLRDLYAALGRKLAAEFSGWRVGIIATDAALVATTGLPLTAGPPVLHGGLKVRLFQSAPLP